jgi:PilZ domain-containing protein
MQVAQLPAAFTDEHRAFPRERTLRSAILFYGSNMLEVPCTIRNISEGGAGVKMPSDMPLPDAVWLLEVSSGIAHRCHVIWRRPAEVGLSFFTSENVWSATEPQLLVIRRVWLAVGPR